MVWLGIFVIGGLTFLSVILYSLGDRQTFFDQTISVKAIFEDVSGLRTGNSVRLSGVLIGNVKEIEIIDDSSVLVSFIIEKDKQRFIRGNATASVVTDGLMGNKMIQIYPAKPGGLNYDRLVQEGDTLAREPTTELADMLTILEKTNENIAALSADLAGIIAKVSSGEGSLGKLISEPDLVNSIQAAIAGIETFSRQGNATLRELDVAVHQITEGEGLVGALLSDSSMTQNLTETMTNLQNTTQDIAKIGVDIQDLLQVIQSGEGTAGTILSNPEMARNLEKTLLNVSEGTEQFNEVMEGLKHNILLRRYFRKKAEAAGSAGEGIR